MRAQTHLLELVSVMDVEVLLAVVVSDVAVVVSEVDVDDDDVVVLGCDVVVQVSEW